MNVDSPDQAGLCFLPMELKAADLVFGVVFYPTERPIEIGNSRPGAASEPIRIRPIQILDFYTEVMIGRNAEIKRIRLVVGAADLLVDWLLMVNGEIRRYTEFTTIGLAKIPSNHC